MSRKNYRAT